MKRNMTTPSLAISIGRSHSRLALLLIPSCSPALRFRRRREPLAQHRTEAIPTTTRLRAMAHSSALQPALITRRSGLMLSIPTPAATTTRPSVLRRSLATQPAAQHGQRSYALSSNTTGNYNTANGVYALYSNTTGNHNTANGVDALLSNTTGNYNTANGVDALS